MREPEPKNVWVQLRDAVRGWWAVEDDGDEEDDSDLVFHLVFTAPLMILLLAMVRGAP